MCRSQFKENGAYWGEPYSGPLIGISSTGEISLVGICNTKHYRVGILSPR